MQQTGMSESTVLLLMSIPLLLIFAMGIVSLILYILVEDELEAREEADKLNPRPDDPQDDMDQLDHAEHVVEVIKFDEDQINKDECIICMDKPKDSLFYPCGHKHVCFDCGRRFLMQARHKVCPICRDRVQDVIRVYE